MGILDKIFGRRPDRSQWPRIVNDITVGFEQIRQKWFETCIDGLEGVASEDAQVRIQRRTLDGNGLRAAKAYQLFLTLSYLAKHRYIPPSEGHDFADLLFAQVCGSDLEQCLHCFARYEKADRGSGLFRFTSDVAEHITGNEAPLMEAMTLSATTPMFAHLSHMVLAASFNDQRTVQSLQRKIEQGG